MTGSVGIVCVTAAAAAARWTALWFRGTMTAHQHREEDAGTRHQREQQRGPRQPERERVGLAGAGFEVARDRRAVDGRGRGDRERPADVSRHVRDPRRGTDLVGGHGRGGSGRRGTVRESEPHRHQDQRDHEGGVLPRGVDEDQEGGSDGPQDEPERRPPAVSRSSRPAGVISGVTRIIAAAAGRVARPASNGLMPNVDGSWK